MGHHADRFIRSLEDAADSIETMPPAEIQALLRRAAIRLRNQADHEGLEEAYRALLDEMNEATKR